MRYFITLSYDGTAYHGWQIQPGCRTIQGELTGALSTLLRRATVVVGAGRTDAGVHARQMTAHFDSADPVDCAVLAYKLNGILPSDMAVTDIRAVSADKHARFSAVSRTYRYYVHIGKDPFARAYSYELHYTPDFDAMNAAASLLIGCGEYGAFCKSHSSAKTMVCIVTRACWERVIAPFPNQNVPAERYHFEITADRFLRNMVRAIVGTLMEVGRGRLTVSQFGEIMRSGDRCRAGESMPANALFLEKITY